MLDKTILRKQNEFSKIYNKGKTITSEYVVVFYIKNELGYNRRAFIASKKIGNSVERNRARRLIREFYRKNSDNFKKSCDYIFVAKRKMILKKAKSHDVEKSLIEIEERRVGKECRSRWSPYH